MKDGGFGKLKHRREMASIDKQDVVRMNRDTLYSSGVFDLDAAPLTITLPDTGKRFMSMQVISEDHYTIEVVYAPGRYTTPRTRSARAMSTSSSARWPIPTNLHDVKAANALQDAIKVEQASVGKFEVAELGPGLAGQGARRACHAWLARGDAPATMFGTKGEVDPIATI